jgi:glycosyltransferase involved in cell wall biosynthesis
MPSRLRIGVNALYLIPGGVGGTEIYLRNLLGALAEIDRRNEYFVYLNRETDVDLCPRQANFAPVDTGVKATFRPGRLIWEQLRLPSHTRTDKLDVLFSPGFTAPLTGSGRRVTVIHDLQHKRQPQNFGRFELMAWEWCVAQSVKTASTIITVSESSKKDIVEFYGTPREDIRVVPHGVEDDFFGLKKNETYGPELLTQAGLPDSPYLLAVSTVHPHKNWERLIDAYEAVTRQEADLQLVISGLPGKSWEGLKKLIASKGLGGRVHLLGWQPRKTLIGLFKYADSLVFASTFEGFGMPVLEALASGTPVACSDIAPLRELADGCASFFDPHSSDDIAAAIRGLRQDEFQRVKFVNAGLQRSKDSTWRRAAQQTLAIFLEAAQR